LTKKRWGGAEKWTSRAENGVRSQEGLAKSHETGNVEDRVRCEMVKLHTVNIKKPTKELVGRKRESAEKEREEHHPVAAQGLGDPFGGSEGDGVIVGDETVCLGLGQILLLESRGHPACCGVCCFTLGHLVLLCQVLHTHPQSALGG
jgi:hypothetical protein